MKIAFIVGDISSSGGIERVTSILTKNLSTSGINVDIISLFCAHEKFQYEFSDRVKIHILSKKKYATQKAGGPKRLMMIFNIIFVLKRFLQHENYDFFIGQGFPITFVLSLLNLNKRTIACEHVNYNYYNSFVQKTRLRIYKKCAQVVVLTFDDLECYRGHIKNVTLIPNPNPFKPTLTSDLSTKCIISVGRLSYEKGFDLLLIAMKDVIKKYPDWILNIFGTGVLENDLLVLRNNLGLDQNVFFKGNSSNIENEYLSSSIFVLSSRFEGFGMVLIEAASFGLPIISFDCPTGPKSILDDNRGILVAPNDVSALSNSIIDLISNKCKMYFYGNQGGHIIADYDQGKINTLWVDLFKLLNIN